MSKKLIEIAGEYFFVDDKTGDVYQVRLEKSLAVPPEIKKILAVLAKEPSKDA